jgi:EAL domain-containing protein (putative c-di-GMP-specific phosphodiesterase class I)
VEGRNLPSATKSDPDLLRVDHVKISLSSVERHYSLRFRVGQIVAAVVGTGALYGSALLTAYILNSEADSNAEQVLKHGLADISNRVVLAVENDFMKHEINDNLADFENWADREASKYLGPGKHLDVIQIVDIGGTEIARFPADGQPPSVWNDFSHTMPADVDIAWGRRGNFTVLNGRVAFYGVAPLLDHPSIGSPDDISIVGLSYISDEDLSELSHLVEVPGLQIILPDQPLPEKDRSIPISGTDDRVIARLSWLDQQPGTEILLRLVPFYLAVSAVMTFLSIFMGRWYRQLIQSILAERERVKKAAETDNLTGLLNRAGVSSLVETSSVRDALNAGRCALLYLDVNSFKRLNDSIGHDCGDQALRILAQRLAGACRKGDVVFQPIVDSQARRMAYAEALLRWNDPILGPVPPSDFIPIAESRGLVPDLGNFVIERCCDALVAMPWLHVSINVSPLQLVHPNFPDQILEAVRKRELDASRIIIEITENALIEVPDTARQRIEQLSAEGFQFALDDFGTGFASISYLRQFPFSALKIDRSFVASLGHDRSSNLLFESMVRLGEGFHLDVVSEGVETMIQAEMIARTGCHFQQGFLHARPMPLTSLESFYTHFLERRNSA